MKIPEPVLGILDTLEAAGFEAWLVGGCVRDMLRGALPHDYDIATSARPAQVQTLFKRTAATGLRYGTVTVLTQDSPGRAEVTTFRREGGYRDGRRPDEVSFDAGLHDDLSRRDFTVNAMAFHPRRGLCDPFSGRKDLAHGVIRTVGNPAARFGEDALRVLRAFRFSATLGFSIEPETLVAAGKAAALVKGVSCERIRDEIRRILLSPRPETAFALLNAGIDCGVFCLPPTAGAETARLAAAPRSAAARWAGFFILLGADDGETVRLCHALKADNATTADVKRLCALLRGKMPHTAADVRRLLEETPPALLREGFLLWGALRCSDPGPLCALLDGVLRRGEAYRISMLAVNGRDLFGLGFSGPACGAALHTLLARVVENPVLNKRETLLHMADILPRS